MGKLKDLTGKTFGKWLVLYRNGSTPNNAAVWHCKCLGCGMEKDVEGASLFTGKSRMCRKCSAKICNATKWHGDPIVHIFSGMWQRCYDKNYFGYKDYGKRGIAICDEWLEDRIRFYEWAYANGYEKGLSIERIDNDLGYFPSNCKFIPKNDQPKNRRCCIFITRDGEKQCLTYWCELFGIDRHSVKYWAKKKGISYEESLQYLLDKKAVNGRNYYK